MQHVTKLYYSLGTNRWCNWLLAEVCLLLLTLKQNRMLDVNEAQTLLLWWMKSALIPYILLLYQSRYFKETEPIWDRLLFRIFLHNHIFKSVSFHFYLPALLFFFFHPPHLVHLWLREDGRGFVASTSRAWCWVTWLPPTTLALSSCHHGNFSILTNMPWHPWPYSPICNPICFTHSIIFSPVLSLLIITPYCMTPATSFYQFSLLCPF